MEPDNAAGKFSEHVKMDASPHAGDGGRSPEPGESTEAQDETAAAPACTEAPVWEVRYFELFGCLMALLLLTGCSDFTMTNPPRTVTEQLLLSTAADKAIKTASLDMFRGKRVFVDGAYFDSYDPKYVLGAIRDAFSQSGALMAPNAVDSDIIAEPRSGGYSIDYSSSLIGIPTLGVPIPLAGTISIPELALYKSSKQNSIAKFAILAYDTKSREHFYSSGPMVGKAYNYYHKCLGFLWVSTDIPEKKKKQEKEGKEETVEAEEHS